MTDDPTPAGNEQSLELAIEYTFLTASNYTNQLVIQADGECMYLHFFQIRPPVILATDTAPPTKVTAHPVACLAVDLEKMAKFVELMESQIALHSKVKRASEESK